MNFKVGDLIRHREDITSSYTVTNQDVVLARVINVYDSITITIEIIKHKHAIHEGSRWDVEAYYFERVKSACNAELVGRCNMCAHIIDGRGVVVNGGVICDGCYNNHCAECFDCKEVGIKNGVYNPMGVLTIHAVNGEFYCNNCIPDHYIMCDRCYRWADENDTVVYRGDKICNSCYNSINHVESYHHTFGGLPFYGEASDELFFGIEIEVDGGYKTNSTAKQVKECFEDYYIVCKEDGSLSCDGFEIVTMPTSYRKLHELYYDFDKMFDIVTNEGFYSGGNDDCGIHIHVSKNAFENWEEVAAKINILMHKHYAEVLEFSGRREDDLEQWANITDYGNMSHEVVLEKGVNNYINWDRYTALNVNNSDTMEFRIFDGTIDVNVLFAYIEFVKCICYFAKNNDLDKIVNCSFADIFAEGDDNLWQYLENNKICNKGDYIVCA